MFEIVGIAALMGVFDGDERHQPQKKRSFIPKPIMIGDRIIHFGCDGQTSIYRIKNG